KRTNSCDYRMSIESGPPQSRPTQKSSSEIERATALMAVGRLDEAITTVGMTVGRDPENQLAWTTLARAQLLSRRYQEALQSAQSAMAIDPLKVDPYLVASQSLSNLRRYSQGIEMAAEGVRLGPDAWLAHAVHGLAFLGGSTAPATYLPSPMA